MQKLQYSRPGPTIVPSSKYHTEYKILGIEGNLIEEVNQHKGKQRGPKDHFVGHLYKREYMFYQIKALKE